MTPVTALGDHSPLVLYLHPVINLTDEQFFFDLCQINRDLRIEQTRRQEN